MQGKIKSGSPFLFGIIRFVNLFYGLSALALFALAIWFWVELNAFNIIEIGFMLFGLVEFILVLLVWTAKTSTVKLRCFLFFMAIIFLAELIVMILVFALGESIINDVVDKIDAKQQFDKLKGYLYLVNYFVIGSLVVEGLLMAFVYCYIGSLRNRNHQYDYKFVDDEGNKMTLDDKNRRDKQKISEKYNKKREQLANKYPGYKNANDY